MPDRSLLLFIPRLWGLVPRHARGRHPSATRQALPDRFWRPSERCGAAQDSVSSGTDESDRLGGSEAREWFICGPRVPQNAVGSSLLNVIHRETLSALRPLRASDSRGPAHGAATVALHGQCVVDIRARSSGQTAASHPSCGAGPECQDVESESAVRGPGRCPRTPGCLCPILRARLRIPTHTARRTQL